MSTPIKEISVFFLAIIIFLILPPLKGSSLLTIIAVKSFNATYVRVKNDVLL